MAAPETKHSARSTPALRISPERPGQQGVSPFGVVGRGE